MDHFHIHFVQLHSIPQTFLDVFGSTNTHQPRSRSVSGNQFSRLQEIAMALRDSAQVVGAASPGANLGPAGGHVGPDAIDLPFWDDSYHSNFGMVD